MFRIRRPDGLYSTGGHSPSFTERGKLWRTLGHVKLHLMNTSTMNVYADCVVEESELKIVRQMPAAELLAERRAAIRAEQQRREETRRAYEEMQARRAYEQLRARFGPKP